MSTEPETAEDDKLKSTLEAAVWTYSGLFQFMSQGRSIEETEYLLYHSPEASFRKSQEFADAVKALEEHPEIATHNNRLVGMGGASRRMDSHSYLFGLLKHVVGGPFASVSFGRAFSEFMAFFRQDYVTVKHLCPLYNFDSDVEALDLSPHVSIRRLTQDEKEQARRRQLTNPFRRSSVFPAHFVLESKWTQTKKVVGDEVMGEPSHPADNVYERVPNLFDRAVAVLRLLRASSVHRDGMIDECPEGFFARIGGLSLGNLHEPAVYGHPLKVSSEDATLCKAIWSHFENSDARARLAVSRLGFSIERREHTDSLLDLFIAMEALYIPSQATELSFRLALAASKTISKTQEEAASLFSFLKRMYALRSRIAHGRSAHVDPDDLKRLSDLVRASVRLYLEKPDRFLEAELERLFLEKSFEQVPALV